LAQGVSPDARSFKALGYPQVLSYIQGSITKEEMVELIQVKTRQFAKRQMTWYRRFDHVEWYDFS